MIEIIVKKLYDTLGYRQSIEGDLTEINSALDHCIEVLQKTVVPRHIVKRLPLTIENHTITIGDMVIHSKNLENNLKRLSCSLSLCGYYRYRSRSFN